jgi:hypothetical protein
LISKRIKRTFLIPETKNIEAKRTLLILKIRKIEASYHSL